MSNAINEIRKEHGWTQQKFSDVLNIPLRTVQKWDIGERKPPEYVIELIKFRIDHDENIE